MSIWYIISDQSNKCRLDELLLQTYAPQWKVFVTNPVYPPPPPTHTHTPPHTHPTTHFNGIFGNKGWGQ